jgi:hypothetical protein
MSSPPPEPALKLPHPEPPPLPPPLPGAGINDPQWNLQKINAGGVTYGPAADADPAASVFSRQQHFGYRAGTGTIWDSWFDAPTDRWNLQQINADGGRTDGPMAFSGPFVWTIKNQQHFAYRDGKGVIWDSWYDGHWNLKNINAGGVTTGPVAVGGPFIWIDSRQQHFTYRDQEGTIWDSWFNGNPPPPTSGSPSGTGLLRINAVSIIVDGSQIDEPIPGQAFNMCINVVNVGAGAALASTLTVEATSSDNSYSQTWTPAVPRINRGDGASVCVPVPALTAGITYDFNFYDPSTNYLGNESFAL